MSKFNELHEYLRECVDSDNDSFIGITEDGVEFNMYEWAFALSVNAKREHDRLVEENKRLREALALQVASPDAFFSNKNKTVTEMSIEILSELDGD